MSRMRLLAGMAWLGLLAPVRADLHFPQTELNLGQVYTGRPLRQRFTFTNRGPGVVEVKELQAACGCMTPRLDKLVYQPGESGSFTLEVNTLTQPAGPNRWRVQVQFTDAGQERTQSLHVCATLVSEIKVEPAKLILSTQGPIRHDIVITDQRALPFRVTHAQTSSPHLSATVSQAEGRTQRVRVEVKESLPPGRHEHQVGIVTDDPSYRELRVPVTVVKRAKTDISVAPETVNLMLSKGQPGSRVVLLRGEGEQEVIVDRIETDSAALACRWAAGPGKMATLKVSVDGAKVVETLKGTVRVHIRKPSPTTVTIPVVCTVR
jgi:hypothetical protein